MTMLVSVHGSHVSGERVITALTQVASTYRSMGISEEFIEIQGNMCLGIGFFTRNYGDIPEVTKRLYDRNGINRLNCLVEEVTFGDVYLCLIKLILQTNNSDWTASFFRNITSHNWIVEWTGLWPEFKNNIHYVPPRVIHYGNSEEVVLFTNGAVSSYFDETEKKSEETYKGDVRGYKFRKKYKDLIEIPEVIDMFFRDTLSQSSFREGLSLLVNNAYTGLLHTCTLVSEGGIFHLAHENLQRSSFWTYDETGSLIVCNGLLPRDLFMKTWSSETLPTYTTIRGVFHQPIR